jgi:hypothetical protein
MDAEKSKKLQQYAVVLNEQATEEEKNGKTEEASKKYLKLVDVFLVLAAEAQDHNTWQQYIRQAEVYQGRIRALIPKDQQGGLPQPTSQRTEVPMRAQSDSPVAKPSPLKKMFRPFQKSEDELPEIASKTPKPTPSLATPSPVPQRATTPIESSVPGEVYQRVLSENKLLRDKITAFTKESEDRITSLEREKSELEARISEMVPRADYDTMQSEFANMVPRTEYDRIRRELLNTVPKEHYDDLLNRIAEMVPKKVYLDTERKVMELEDAIKNSIPKKVVEELASEVSLLGLLSEIPMQRVEPLEEEKTEG